MAKPTKRRRTTRSAVATASAPTPSPPRIASPSLSPAPSSHSPSSPEDHGNVAAVFKYLKAQGLTSTLTTLATELAEAAQKRRTASRLSASSLFWANDDTVSEVVSFLGMSDLRSCLALSKALYRAAAPLLYRRLRVVHPNCHCKPPPDRDLNLVSRYTTALELFPHQHVQHYLKALEVPRLRTLVLNYDSDSKSEPHGKGSALHNCRFCPAKPPTADRVVVRPIAGLFKGKKPATIIVVPTGTGSEGPSYFARHQTVAPETIIHVARMTSQTKYSRSFWMQPRAPINKPQRSITFVLLPIMWDHGPVGNRRPPWGEAKSVGNLGTSLIDAITEYCLHFGDHKVQVIGLEDANPFAMPDHWAARTERRAVFEKAFADKLETLMTTSFRYGKWTDEQREWRRDSITLTKFTDYLRGGSWGEEMDWQLVGRWLNTYELREQGMLGTLARKPRKGKRANAKGKQARGRKRKLVFDDSDNGGESDDSADSDYVA